MTPVYVRSSSPIKATGHTDCIGMLPQRDTPSRWGYITVSPNFTETKKGKQNEKTEEFVSIERTREKMPKKTGEVEIIYQIKSSKR